MGALTASGLFLHQVKQPSEVIEAYRACERFERLMRDNLDFDRAYEATFTKVPARRRAIAIADGEFGALDYAAIDDDLLIKAYKLRMQAFYLILVLAGPSDEEARLFFPPELKTALQRQPPHDPREFPVFVAQLQRDVSRFRAHVDQLAARYPSVADRVNKFRSETLAAKFEPPVNSRVEPLRGYYRSSVLSKDDPYYQIDTYTVVREGGKMRIVGIRFFNRLF